MTQNFDFNFNPDEEENAVNADDPHYKVFSSIGHVRNLCLTWPNGNRKFLNYAYLVSGSYSKDESSITLVFTSETVILKGIRLNQMFQDFLSHIPQEIICIEKRYNQAGIETNPIVNTIQILE